eukprot:763089-Hanusia_phi.AAC.6
MSRRVGDGQGEICRQEEEADHQTTDETSVGLQQKSGRGDRWETTSNPIEYPMPMYWMLNPQRSNQIMQDRNPINEL